MKIKYQIGELIKNHQLYLEWKKQETNWMLTEGVKYIHYARLWKKKHREYLLANPKPKMFEVL